MEHLRGVMGELHVADVRPHLARKTLALFRAGERPQVLLINALDFENYATFVLKEVHEKALNALLDKLIAWGTAFKIMREAKAGS